MEKFLLGLQYVEVEIYLDDIIVYAKSLQDQESMMVLLFQRPFTSNLKVHSDEVKFLQEKLHS